MTTLPLKIMIAVFVVGAVVSLFKKDWAMLMYYGGAILLNVGVLIK